MKTKPAYLVLGFDRSSRLTIRRVTQTWPALDPGELIVRVALELLDDVVAHPVHVLELPAEAIAVAVDPEAPLELPEPDEDER